MRALALAISTLFAALVLAATPTAHAQEAEHAREADASATPAEGEVAPSAAASGLDARARLLLDAELDRQLQSIDSEASAATALYVTGVVLHVGGIATIVSTAIAGFCLSWGSGDSCASERQLASTGAIVGSIATVLGLAGIFVGVGLDVDSGHRRRDLSERRTLLLGLNPTAGGSEFTLRGTF